MADETLRGWNAIADFLSCDVRPAKRWEQVRHLPVRRTRRTPGEGRANVYALKQDLEAWIASANALPESPQQPESSQEVEFSEGAYSARNISVATVVSAPIASPQPIGSRWKAVTLPVAGVALTVVALMVWGAAHLAGRELGARGGSGKTNRSVPPANPADARAQELYLHGSYLFEQRTPETLEQARLDFQTAIAASPKYAPAYAGLAKTYALLREYSTLPTAEAYPLAKEAAQKAISLDPNLADVHSALGYEEFFWEWDAPRAEAEFKQAIALDPTSPLAHHWYGSMLTHQTRFAEAINELNQAQMLAPDSAGILGSRSFALGLSGKRAEAADMLQDILTRIPDSAPLHIALAKLCLLEPRDIPRYLDQMRRFAELRHIDEQLALLKAGEDAYHEQGEEKMWQTMLQMERQLHPDTEHPTYFIVQLEAVLAMKDAALRDLTLLVRNHNEQSIGIEIDPLLFPLRSDPRFARIAHQVGLPNPPPAIPAPGL
jgi:tetratricopeptide (TPR) repeat protein